MFFIIDNGGNYIIIRPFNINTDKTRIIEVWNKVLNDINPTWTIKEEELEVALEVEGDQTDLSRDCLIAEDNNGKMNGFAILFKSSKRDPWWLELKVLPKHFKSNLLIELFEAILDLANKQCGPKILFNITKYIYNNSPLRFKFENMGLKPDHYDFWMRMENFHALQKLDTPQGITFQKKQKLSDFTNFVKVLNDAFKNHFDFIPYEENDFKTMHNTGWKGYNVEYWFAFEKNNPVGICVPIINPNLEEVGIINTLGVLHSHHHNGIGSTLLGLGIQSLIEKGCKTIELGVEAKNERALNLYRKSGFYEVDSRTLIFFIIG